jgi:hypothetical protein
MKKQEQILLNIPCEIFFSWMSYDYVRAIYMHNNTTFVLLNLRYGMRKKTMDRSKIYWPKSVGNPWNLCSDEMKIMKGKWATIGKFSTSTKPPRPACSLVQWIYSDRIPKRNKKQRNYSKPELLILSHQFSDMSNTKHVMYVQRL